MVIVCTRCGLHEVCNRSTSPYRACPPQNSFPPSFSHKHVYAQASCLHILRRTWFFSWLIKENSYNIWKRCEMYPADAPWSSIYTNQFCLGISDGPDTTTAGITAGAIDAYAADFTPRSQSAWTQTTILWTQLRDRWKQHQQRIRQYVRHYSQTTTNDKIWKICVATSTNFVHA